MAEKGHKMKREKTAIDIKYAERLEDLYQLAVDKKEPATAMVLLDKIRNLELYLDRPAKEKDEE